LHFSFPYRPPVSTKALGRRVDRPNAQTWSGGGAILSPTITSTSTALYSLLVGDSKNEYGDVDVGNPTLLQVPYKLLKVRNTR
jgi:hypothetical protein